MNKNKIATWVGFAGGAVFFILNIATKGQVPGGFQGGVAGFVIGYALAWLVLAFIPSKKKVEDSEQPPRYVSTTLRQWPAAFTESPCRTLAA